MFSIPGAIIYVAQISDRSDKKESFYSKIVVSGFFFLSACNPSQTSVSIRGTVRDNFDIGVKWAEMNSKNSKF